MKKVCFVSDFKSFSYQIDKYYIRSGEKDTMAWINRASKITVKWGDFDNGCYFINYQYFAFLFLQF